MLRKRINEARWNKVAKNLGGKRVAARGRGLDVEHEVKLCLDIAEQQIQELNISETDSVLDIGCSEGFFARRFAQSALYVKGIDSASRMIEMAKSKSENISNLEFEVASALEIPCEDSAFDKVNCFGVLQYLGSKNEVKSAFCEISRTLKPGGYAYIGDVFEDKYKLLNIIFQQNKEFGYIKALFTYVCHVVVFTLAPPTLFFSKKEFETFGQASGLRIVKEHKTIDELYESEGLDFLLQKTE